MCQRGLAWLTDPVGDLACPHGDPPHPHVPMHNGHTQGGQASGRGQLLPDTLVPVPSLCVYLLSLNCIRFPPSLSVRRGSVMVFLREGKYLIRLDFTT